MSIPTPAALKTRLDEKKAMESKSSTKDDLSAPRSSRDRSRAEGASSSRTSRPKRSTSSQETSSPSSQEASETTENSRSKDSRGKEPSKKAFVLPDHLTQKPLRDNDALLALKKKLEHPARGQFKREYHVGGRRSGKQSKMNNKENN